MKASIYDSYTSQLKTDDILVELTQSGKEVERFYRELPSHLHHFAYAPEKWTLNQVLRHLIDCERIFACRAMRFSRNDKTPLPGFDENAYMEEMGPEPENPSAVLEEFISVRKSTVALFASLSEEMMQRRGIANGLELSVHQIGLITAGHTLHHLKINKERYI